MWPVSGGGPLAQLPGFTYAPIMKTGLEALIEEFDDLGEHVLQVTEESLNPEHDELHGQLLDLVERGIEITNGETPLSEVQQQQELQRIMGQLRARLDTITREE